MEQMRTTLFLPGGVHRGLKKLSQRRQTSVTKLILQAVREAYFSDRSTSARSLWGSVPKARLSDKDFRSAKLGLNPKK